MRALAHPAPALVLILLTLGSLVPPAQPAPQEPQNTDRSVVAALPKGKKLVLTDGSFQLVREYEERGDRVRFYSVERSAWEEIPAALVDWKATRRAAEEEAREREETLERMRAIRMAERAASIDVDSSLEIAPGVFLPDGLGLFILDGDTVLPLTQSLSELKRDKTQTLKQILIPIPIVPSKHRLQVPGRQAAVRITTAHPEFYMRTADDREPTLELVRARVRGDAREVEVLNTIPISGEQYSERNTISVQRWQVARRVWRLTLSQALELGEYAIIEIVPGEGTNFFVWDFGADRPATKP